jgi:hypothetical protein
MEATMTTSFSKPINDFLHWAYSRVIPVSPSPASGGSESLKELSPPKALLQIRQQAMDQVPYSCECILKEFGYSPLMPALPNNLEFFSVPYVVVGARRNCRVGFIDAIVEGTTRKAYHHGGIHPRAGLAIGRQPLEPSQIPEKVWTALEEWQKSLQS